MPLGNPIRKQNESRILSVLATEGQTVFTVQGGYIVNHISVFRNGVRLSNAEDFTAGDGSTVTLNNAANIDDRLDFHVFDRFTVSGAIVSAASTQTISGDVVLTGKLFGELDVPSINTGIATVTELDVNGKGDISSDLTITRHLSVGGISTVGKAIIGTGVTIDQSNIDTVGIITATTFNGNVTATTLTGTLQTAAQTNITSVGTLTGLTVSADTTFNGVTFGKGASDNTGNTVVGETALDAVTTGVHNTAVGKEALTDNTTGSENNAFGAQALANNTTGGKNNAFGKQALEDNTTGNNNTAFGHDVLRDNTTADNNTAFGCQSLASNTTG